MESIEASYHLQRWTNYFAQRPEGSLIPNFSPFFYSTFYSTPWFIDTCAYFLRSFHSKDQSVARFISKIETYSSINSQSTLHSLQRTMKMNGKIIQILRYLCFANEYQEKRTVRILSCGCRIIFALRFFLYRFSLTSRAKRIFPRFLRLDLSVSIGDFIFKRFETKRFPFIYFSMEVTDAVSSSFSLNRDPSISTRQAKRRIGNENLASRF